MKAYVIRQIEETNNAPIILDILKGHRAYPVCDGYAERLCYADKKTAQRVCSRYSNGCSKFTTYRVVEVNVDESIKSYRDAFLWHRAHNA